MVINVGQAGGRSAITPERIAINFQAGSTPDNSGKGPKEGKIETDGADGYFTQLPIKQMVTAIRQVAFQPWYLIPRALMSAITYSMKCNTCACTSSLI